MANQRTERIVILLAMAALAGCSGQDENRHILHESISQNNRLLVQEIQNSYRELDSIRIEFEHTHQTPDYSIYNINTVDQYQLPEDFEEIGGEPIGPIPEELRVRDGDFYLKTAYFYVGEGNPIQREPEDIQKQRYLGLQVWTDADQNKGFVFAPRKDAATTFRYDKEKLMRGAFSDTLAPWRYALRLDPTELEDDLTVIWLPGIESVKVDGHECLVVTQLRVHDDEAHKKHLYWVQLWLDPARDYIPLRVEKYGYEGISADSVLRDHSDFRDLKLPAGDLENKKQLRVLTSIRYRDDDLNGWTPEECEVSINSIDGYGFHRFVVETIEIPYTSNEGQIQPDVPSIEKKPEIGLWIPHYVTPLIDDEIDLEEASQKSGQDGRYHLFVAGGIILLLFLLSMGRARKTK